MNNQEQLDLITQIRGEVTQKRKLRGRNPFLIWGYTIAIVYLLTFITIMLWNNDICLFILCGIVVVGIPFMQDTLHDDYKRSHMRSKEDDYVLKVWLFVGVALGVAALATGLAGLHHLCLFPLAGLLIGMGSFFTGVIMRFRPKKVCGIIACSLSAISLFLQGDLWPWQLFAVAVITVIALIIPGHMYNSYLRKNNQLES